MPKTSSLCCKTSIRRITIARGTSRLSTFSISRSVKKNSIRKLKLGLIGPL